METSERTCRLAAVAFALAWAGTVQAQTDGGGAPLAAPVPLSQCVMCHDKAVSAFKTTHHGELSQSCTACHGDSTGHLKGAVEKASKAIRVTVGGWFEDYTLRGSATSAIATYLPGSIFLAANDGDYRAHVVYVRAAYVW